MNNHDDSTVLQQDLYALENWTRNWQMKFNVEKCSVMHIGRTNVHSAYYMNNSVLGITNEEKDLGIIITDDLLVSKHCASAYSKANKILGMIISRDNRLLLSLYKTLVRPHLEYCSSAWSPHYQKDKKTSGEGTASFYKNDN